jgi:DNA primase
VELVSQFVALKRAGALYKGLCPFHSEKTPSFVVTPQRQMFHCFGCGAGGDPIRFLMMITGQNFPESVEELARRYGVDLPATEAGDRPRGESRENRLAIFEALSQARDFFEVNLWSEAGQTARRYLAGRGLNQRTAKAFGLGLSLPDWEALRRHLAAAGFSDEVMLKAGLIKPGRQSGQYYDHFRDRLMVPIVNTQGQVSAFGGRVLPGDDQPAKYINSPETPVYTKGDILYGYHRARPYLRANGQAFVVEGYFDLISLVAAGVNEVVAPLGTALTTRQASLLRGQADRVILLFDADEAGQKAAARSLPILMEAELEGRVLTLPEDHDPDTFIREFGDEALYEAAARAVEITEFVAARLRRAHPDTPAGQSRLLGAAREILGQVRDLVKRQLLARRLADLLEIDPAWLGDGGLRRQLAHQASGTPPPRPATYDQTAGALLKIMLIYPEVAPQALAEMAAWWPDDASRPLFERLKESFETRGTFSPEDASGLQPDEMAALVAEAAVSERVYPPEQALKMAGDYMKKIKASWLSRRRQEISAALKKAESRGDEAETDRLTREKNDLLYKMKGV